MKADVLRIPKMYKIRWFRFTLNCQEVPKRFQRSSKEVPHNFQRSSKKSSKKVPKKFKKSSKKVQKKVQSCQKIVRSCLLITLIKCLKGHRSLGSLFDVKSKSTLSESVSESVSEWVTRSPIELFWTAKKMLEPVELDVNSIRYVKSIPIHPKSLAATLK